MDECRQVVVIDWVDRGQPVPGWQWLSETDPSRAHKCVKVGFLVQDDEQTKVLAPNLGASSGGEDWDQASGLFTIPTVSITKIERLTSSSTSAQACGQAAA